jgi:cell wall-associated NlpC family hydrolase
MDSKTHREMVKIITGLMGTPFKLGGLTPETGFDCLSFPVHVYERLGFQRPLSFEGRHWENYWQDYQTPAGYALFERFLKSLGSEVPPAFKLPGDLLILQGEGHITAAIQLLNQKATRVDPKAGVIIFPSHLIKDLRGVRRVV